MVFQLLKVIIALSVKFLFLDCKQSAQGHWIVVKLTIDLVFSGLAAIGGGGGSSSSGEGLGVLVVVSTLVVLFYNILVMHNITYKSMCESYINIIIHTAGHLSVSRLYAEIKLFIQISPF